MSLSLCNFHHPSLASSPLI